MTSSSNEHWSRLLLILVKGGSYVIKGVLEREMTKRAENLDSLLQKQKPQLQQKLLPKQYDTLFPVSGRTNLQVWDIDLLIKVTLCLFNTSLSVTERDKLRTIQSVRNEISQLSEATVDTFKLYIDDVLSAINSLSSGLSTSIQLSKDEIIRRCSDPVVRLQQLKEIGQTDSEIEKIIKQFHDAHLGNEGKQFEVEVLPSKLATLCGISLKSNLCFESTNICFKDPASNKLQYEFSITWIRRFGCKSKSFYFEVGRNCPNGEGTVSCNTEYAKTIHHVLNETVTRLNAVSVTEIAANKSSSADSSTNHLDKRTADKDKSTPNRDKSAHHTDNSAEFKKHVQTTADVRKLEFITRCPVKSSKQNPLDGTGKINSAKTTEGIDDGTDEYGEYVNLNVRRGVTAQPYIR